MASRSPRAQGMHRGNRGAGYMGSMSPHREQWPDVSQSDVLRIRGGQIGPCAGMRARNAAARQAISSSKPLADEPAKPTELVVSEMSGVSHLRASSSRARFV